MFYLRFASALALSLGALLITPVQAALVTQTFNFTADATTVDGGFVADFIGTEATGSFTYDDALIVLGDEALDPSSFVLSFTIFGDTFDATNDVDAPAFPVLGFSGGIPSSLDYILVAGVNGVTLPATVIQVSSFTLFASSGAVDFEGPLFIDTAVPVPPTLLLLGLGLLGLARARSWITRGTGTE